MTIDDGDNLRRMPIVTVSGPRDAGPAEREQMLDRAAVVFADSDVSDPTRIDVPGRGAGTTEGNGQLRDQVQQVVPALQSGSLFGDVSGVLVVDAQNLLKVEAEIIAELVAGMDGEVVAAVFVATGAVPAPLGKLLRDAGETVTVKKIRERDASRWLGEASRARGLRLDDEAAAELLHRFGSDTAALGRALDQLEVIGGTVTADTVQGRFRNRPDEPMWHYTDAIAAGDEGEALRRLEDFLEHSHPLVLLAGLENDVRRRSLAAAAPDVETYADWLGSTPSAYPVRKVWDLRNRATAVNLRRSLDAVSRADLQMKTAPEATHRVTLERLTVALCRWLG